MAEKEDKRDVVVSEQFTNDLKSVFEYGEEIFGTAAAKSFVSDIYSKIWALDQTWAHHAVCRHLPTSEKKYRNIIVGKYLIIFRVDEHQIKVLRILHGHSSIEKIQSSKKV
jgi:plasmid stabilization system protein ParE